MRVVVVGAGYVGLTTGVALAHVGHKVQFVDTNQSKIKLLRTGKSPIHEPGLDELINLNAQRTEFYSYIGEYIGAADLIMIAVGTPPKTNGEAETRFVEEAVTEVAQQLRDGSTYTFVVKSTVPIGTNRRVAELVRRTLQGQDIDAKVYVASNPEFLREGSALKDAFYPDRIVVGAEDPAAIDALRRLYRPFLEQTFDAPPAIPRPEGLSLPPLITTDPTSAEMIKYAANAFLALKISYINEIAGLCEKVGADVVEVSRGIGLDPRIGPGFLNAGLGWGGSCFPKDTLALLAMGSEFGYEMPIVEAARKVNIRQRTRAIEKLQQGLKALRGRTVGVLGLAFKPGTDDIREAPALDVVRRLLELGAHVRAHDPIALDNARKVLGDDLDIEFFDDPYEMAEGADALVLATEWPMYKKLSLKRLADTLRGGLLVDGRNVFDPEEAKAAGLRYMGVGR